MLSCQRTYKHHKRCYPNFQIQEKTSIAKITSSHGLQHFTEKGFQNFPDGGKITVIKRIKKWITCYRIQFNSTNHDRSKKNRMTFHLFASNKGMLHVFSKVRTNPGEIEPLNGQHFDNHRTHEFTVNWKSYYDYCCLQCDNCILSAKTIITRSNSDAAGLKFGSLPLDHTSQSIYLK